MRYFTMPGFNFGLASAVPQFNRVPEAMVAVARRLMGVCCTHFFDDFCVSEPTRVARSGQRALRLLMHAVGLPFSEEKAVDVSSVVVFLGVESDFTRLLGTGCVRMRVRPDRVEKLQQRCWDVLADEYLPSSIARSLCGKLGFTTGWTFGKVGRAALQPIFRATDASEGPRSRRRRERKRQRRDNASAPKWAEENVLTDGARASLRFFAEVLPHLPVHEFATVASGEPPTLVWTDARWDEGDEDPAGVGFVVAVPREGTRLAERPSLAALREGYVFYHGSAIVSEDFMEGFVRRKQQIGQLELLGALLPYLSCPDLFRNKRVIHWIDNQSALAGLTKGYSGVLDSARIVHAFHATCAGPGAAVWLEYVRSRDDVADEPSRVGLSEWDYDIGVHSEPVEYEFPQQSRWKESAVE